MSAYKVTVRTIDGLSLKPVLEYAETQRAACRQVLASLPNGWKASARIEDETDVVREALAIRMSGFPLIGGAA